MSKEDYLLRVVPSAKRSMEYLYLAGVFLVLVVVCLAITAKQRENCQLGYSITDMRNENALLAEKRDRYLAELARVSAPERIIAESSRLGLRSLPADHYIKVTFSEKGQPLPKVSVDDMVAYSGVRP